MKLYYLFFLLLLYSAFAQAQQIGSLKTYDHKKQNGSILKVYAENGLITLTAIKANIVKVSYAKIETDSVVEKPMLTPVNIRITQNLDDIFMFTDSLIIIINKLDFSIKFEKRNEDVLLVNKNFTFNPSNMSTWFITDEKEIFYNKKTAHLKGKRQKIKQTKAFYSSKKYAIFFPKKEKVRVCFDVKNLVTYESEGSSLYYYFVAEDACKCLGR